MGDYDAIIRDHYAAVAAEAGLSASSTMKNELIRAHETAAIESFIRLTTAGAGRVADFGCGNGHTLGVLRASFPRLALAGYEYTDALRALAQQRFATDPGVSIASGDVRMPGFFGQGGFDAAIVQRVLINLLDPADQAHALDNIVQSVRPGGHLLFIECFEGPYDALNEARAEFDLEPLAPAHHNRYLPEGFFQHADLLPFAHPAWAYPPNFLSTLYFVSRALEPGLTQPRPFKRNSQLQRFLVQALPPAVGDYSPLQFHPFQRKPGSPGGSRLPSP